MDPGMKRGEGVFVGRGDFLKGKGNYAAGQRGTEIIHRFVMRPIKSTCYPPAKKKNIPNRNDYNPPLIILPINLFHPTPIPAARV
jgi:hypothetical protein